MTDDNSEMPIFKSNKDMALRFYTELEAYVQRTMGRKITNEEFMKRKLLELIDTLEAEYVLKRKNPTYMKHADAIGKEMASVINLVQLSDI